MSGYLETFITLATVDTATAPKGLARLHAVLVAHFAFDESLASCIYRLRIGDPAQAPMGLIDSQPLPLDNLADAATQAPAFVVRGNILLGDVSDQVELYCYQSAPHGRFAVRAVLASSFLQAVYTEDGFDQAQAQALRNFTLTLASCVGTDGFALELWLPSTQLLEERPLQHFLDRALRPTLASLQAQPLYLIGVRSLAATRADMVATWGQANVLESTEGYLMADLLSDRGGD